MNKPLYDEMNKVMKTNFEKPEETEIEEAISSLEGLAEAGKLSATMSSTQVNKCLYAVIAKLESIAKRK